MLYEGRFKTPSMLHGQIFRCNPPDVGAICTCAGSSVAYYRFDHPRSVVQRTSSGRLYDHSHVHPFALPFKRTIFIMPLECC